MNVERNPEICHHVAALDRELAKENVQEDAMALGNYQKAASFRVVTASFRSVAVRLRAIPIS